MAKIRATKLGADAARQEAMKDPLLESSPAELDAFIDRNVQDPGARKVFKRLLRLAIIGAAGSMIRQRPAAAQAPNRRERRPR